MTDLMDNSTPSKSDNPISKYARKLKSCYQQLPADKWSPARAKVSKFIDVVLENKSMDENASLNLDELFNLPCRSWVLLEGISGIGKSTLAYEMCKRWANGTALQEYSLVILLSLREDDVQHKWSPDKLEDLLIGTYLNKQTWKLQVVQDITDNDGEGLLIILEGFDELPEEKQQELDILKRMKRDYSEATVMITTRSSSAHLLSKPIQFVKHFEIHGFNVHNQNRYIEIFLKDDKALIESFKKYIDRYPVISRCLRIPLNLAIVLEIFCRPISTSHSQLPETMTELYESLIKMVIYREKESQAPAGTQIQFSNLKKLPEGTQEAFNNLCALAYEGIILNRQQQVFYKPEKFETLGLMRRESKVLDGGDTFAYSFLHITIQEFLAAYYIHHFLPKEIQSHFDKYNNVYKLFVTMRFLTGLTKLQDGRLSITIPDERISSMSIFHQLMEAKNDALVSRILNKRGTITVARVSSYLTEQDFYILGKCIGLSSCTWKLGFTLRTLKDKHIKMLVAGFEAVKRPIVKDAPRLEHVVFSLNKIGSGGIISFINLPPFVLKTISELYLRATSIDKDCLQHCIPKFDHFIKLETFLFHDNNFKEGEQQPLINALSKLKYLKKVSFSNLSSPECVGILANIREIELYDLSPSSIEAVFTTLSQCRKLECVEIYQSQITKEIAGRAFAQSRHPFPFRSLKLINCAIDSDTACLIVDAVTRSPTLQTLDLSDNIIDDIGGCHIAGRIGLITAKSLPLSEIFLHHNSFSEETIYCLIEQLAWCPSNVFIYLSLQWELVINKHVHHHSFQNGALKHFKFERPNPHMSN